MTVIDDYYADVLCVWAWKTQGRVDELRAYYRVLHANAAELLKDSAAEASWC